MIGELELLVATVGFAGDDDDFSSGLDVAVSIANGVLVEHKVGLGSDVFSARPDEAEEGQNSDQKCLADQELFQYTIVALEVILDHGVDFAQLFSDHIEVEGRR